MAIDEYECVSCRNVTVKRRRINDKPIPTATCGDCGNSSIYLISAHAKTASNWEV